MKAPLTSRRLVQFLTVEKLYFAQVAGASSGLTSNECCSLKSIDLVYRFSLMLDGAADPAHTPWRGKMRYLAQVQKKAFLGKAGLRLLAQERSEYAWGLTSEEDVVLAAEASNLSEGLLVLVELDSNRQVTAIADATDWVLDITQKFLSAGITPAFFQQEVERAEQWRQTLTLQSQEVDRRALELEARREQIQELEEKLKREKRMIESMATQYETKMSATEMSTTEMSATE
ncbi:MAG TPA: hypothetical protein V6D18_02460 [Thermosynechococcaceae cyanobacterium]